MRQVVSDGFRGTVVMNRQSVDTSPRLGGVVWLGVADGPRRSRSMRPIVYIAGGRPEGTSAESEPSEERGRAGDEAQRLIDAWQQPPRAECASRRFVRATVPTTGAGAQITALTTVFAEAIAAGEVLLLAGSWKYAEGSCASGSLECFFLPLSACADGLADGDAAVRPRAWRDFKSDVYSDHAELVPEQFARWGWTWWRAQLLRYLLRPNARTAAHLDAARARLGLRPRRPSGDADADAGGRIVGIHLRRGERLKRSHERHDALDLMAANSLDHALQAALPTLRRVRATRVFLAADSDEFAPSTRTHTKAGIEVLRSDRRVPLDGRDCAREDSVGCESTSPSRSNRTQTTLDMITDFVLLSECDALVGSFGSTFSRLPMLLMLAHERNRTRFTSLE
jgi:hypothetical protein